MEDENNNKALWSDEEKASLLSRLTFLWMRGLFRRAQERKKTKTTLDYEDLLQLPSRDHSRVIYQDFAASWKLSEPCGKSLGKNGCDKEQRQRHRLNLSEIGANCPTDRVARAIIVVLGRPFWTAGGIKILNTFLQFSFPLLLNAILLFIEETQKDEFAANDPWYVRYRGYWLSALLFLAMLGKALTDGIYFHTMNRSRFKARVAVSTAVYHKALLLSNSERQSTTLGELVNLMQVDATKIEMFIPQFHTLWDGLLQIFGYITILYSLIGWPCFAGLLLMIMTGPIQAVVMGKLQGLHRRMVTYTDARVKVTNEALQGIQSVKMFAWEENFQKSIGANRSHEMFFLRQVAKLRGFSVSYMFALPGLVAVTSFAIYAVFYQGASLTASTLFAALVAFDQLRFPLLFYPSALAQFAQAKVSAARVQMFLTMGEIQSGDQATESSGIYMRQIVSEDGSQRGSILMEKATIYWNDPSVPLDIKAQDCQQDAPSGVNDEENRTLGSLSDSDKEKAVHYAMPVLKDITLSVNPGELCGVVGRVGTGKSTLCLAILNETFLAKGRIKLTGKVAYAAQTPWIMNATLRDNILFGRAMDEERYQKVLRVCQLTHDLDMLEGGDMTEIGEKGINLSGGQRARVSVARACYADAETVILDDPLSALDPEVAQSLFQQCIIEFLSGRTRLLITNQVHFLKSCDSVVVLGEGTAIEQGPYEELIADKNGVVRRLLKENEAGDGSSASSARAKESRQLVGEKPQQHQKAVVVEKNKDSLITEEERTTGAVAFSVYCDYIKAGGGYLKFLVVLLAYILSVGNGVAATAWVSYWTADSNTYATHSEQFYLCVYAGLAATLGIFTYLRAFLLARFGVTASGVLHQNLLSSVLRAPLSFFDTTPIGRIISRFSKDLHSIDFELSECLDFTMFCALQLLASICAIFYVTPWFGVAIAPLGTIYLMVLNYYREVSRETKRLDSISRSPVYAWFSETLSGMVTLRAYRQAQRFGIKFENQVDVNTRAFYNNRAAERWLALRLEMIGSTVAGLAAFFACNVAVLNTGDGQGSGSNFSSMAGLSLTLAIAFTSVLNFGARFFSNFEATMTACERVIHYAKNIQQEAAWSGRELQGQVLATLGANNMVSPKNSPSVFAASVNDGKADEVPPNWPEKGAIVMKNLMMKYRSDTPLVLKGLDVEIYGGERIGIIGRTGSGKSSLLSTLLRLVEPTLGDITEKEYESPILVDGIDILRIGLRDLRSRLGIIPQNPVLFSGSIRSNIDPFNEYKDVQIWDALRQCYLYDAVMKMPGYLGAPVAEYGENLSVGMRQMLVLGRALLQQCRILLLDEATSAMDFETDRAIQKTLREAFVGCTVLTIAHRVNTIMDSDKILVMQDGRVKEFAPPEELLKDDRSSFSEIVRHAGDLTL